MKTKLLITLPLLTIISTKISNGDNDLINQNNETYSINYFLLTKYPTIENYICKNANNTPAPPVNFFYYYVNETNKIASVAFGNPLWLNKWKKDGPTRILIHGFRDSADGDNMEIIRNAYFSHNHSTNHNIIAVDWSSLSKSICYSLCVSKIHDIGKEIADLIRYLNTQLSVNHRDIYLIGHSLGAHIAGSVGHNLFKSGKKVGAIYALDPAGPLFNKDIVDIDQVVDRRDADYVEVIHTDVKDGFGIVTHLGHADFYINGGSNQQGCKNKKVLKALGVLESITEKLGTYTKIFNTIKTVCTNYYSHKYACEIFAKSVEFSLKYPTNDKLRIRGFPCDSELNALDKRCSNDDDLTEVMGGDPFTYKYGKYLVLT